MQTSSIYRHFKGGYYIVHSLACTESTGEEQVVYQSLQDGRVWIRPVSEFQEPVPGDKPNPTGQKLRFEKVSDFNNQLSIIPTDRLIEELFSRADCPADIKLFDKNRIWRTEYLIGYFRELYVDEDTVNEDFIFVNIADTLEEAKEKIEKSNNPILRILMRNHVKVDFD